MSTYFNTSNTSPEFTRLFFKVKFITALNSLPDKGNLAYEYNPFRNYRMEYDLYKHDELGRLLDSKGNIIPPISIINPPNATKTVTLNINNIYNIIRENSFYTEAPTEFPDFTKALDSDEIT
jgi:hypothetical protein